MIFLPPLITIWPVLQEAIPDIIDGAGDATGEEWVMRVAVLSALGALAFVGKYALGLPRKSEVDQLAQLNSELRQEVRDLRTRFENKLETERTKRENAEKEATTLRMENMMLKMQSSDGGHTES